MATKKVTTITGVFSNMIEAFQISSYLLEEMKYNLVSIINRKKKKRSPEFDQELLEAYK